MIGKTSKPKGREKKTDPFSVTLGIFAASDAPRRWCRARSGGGRLLNLARSVLWAQLAHDIMKVDVVVHPRKTKCGHIG